MRELKGVVRTMKYALTELHNNGVRLKHPILLGLVAYASGQISRGQVHSIGQTPHQRQKEHSARRSQYLVACSTLFLG